MGTTSQKLTYLNDTKIKIRDRINAIGGSLDSDDTFRSYADELENLYNEMPKVTDTGDNITLENTRKGAMSITYNGDTQQDIEPTPSSPQPINVVTGRQELEICGKNLFNKDNVQLKEGTNVNGVEGHVFSTTTANTQSTTIIPVPPNTDITLSYNGSSYSTNSRFYLACLKDKTTEAGKTGGWYTSKTTFTTNSKTHYLLVTVQIRDSGGNNQEATQTLINDAQIQVEIGSTNTTYEAYTGYTQEINLGKNLFDKDNVIEDYLINHDTGVEASNSNYACSQYISVEPNTIYTGTGFNFWYCVLYDKNKQYLSYTTANNGTFTTPNNAKYIRMSLQKTNLSTAQLEKGSQATSYSSYFTPIELCKISTYQDYIYKTNDRWFLHKEIGKVVLDGSESWTISNTGTSNWYYQYSSSYIPIQNVQSISYGVSSHYIPANIGNNNTNQGISLLTNGYLRIRYGTEDTTSNFKTWLSTHNTTVYYVLNEATETEITNSALLEQLETIKRSYDGVTNISQENNDLAFILDVSALKEWNNE